MDHVIDVPELFGSDVFTKATMKQRLAPEIYQAWKSCIAGGGHLPLDVAQPIAEAMKDWAIEKGATHFTNWFQPMTGITAEKHDSFISPTDDGRVIPAMETLRFHAGIREEHTANSCWPYPTYSDPLYS